MRQSIKKSVHITLQKEVTGLSTTATNDLIANVRASHLQVIFPTHIREAIHHEKYHGMAPTAVGIIAGLQSSALKVLDPGGGQVRRGFLTCRLRCQLRHKYGCSAR